MAILSESEILKLSDPSLVDQDIVIVRGESKSTFRLIKAHSHGNKGLVWKGKDDIGNTVAVKFIPKREYEGTSINDEMSKAQKLGGKYFAETIFFGEVSQPMARVAEMGKETKKKSGNKKKVPQTADAPSGEVDA